MFSPKPGQRNLPSASLRNQLTWKMRGVDGELALHLDPVAEVVAHVVAAEGQHGHGVAADLADGSGGGGGGLGAHGGAGVDAGAPVEGLVDERHGGGRRPPKMMAEMGTPSGASQSGRCSGALRGGRGEAAVGVGGGPVSLAMAGVQG
jgi:hypothetical protein